MQQFEESIQRIATGVQSIDPARDWRARSRQLEETIDALHARIARIDTDARPLGASESAGDRSGRRAGAIRSRRPRQVLARADAFEWLPDRLGVGPQYAPRFTDEDIVRAASRRGGTLGEDIVYAGRELPAPAAFPDPAVSGADAPGSGALGAHDAQALRHGRVAARGWSRCAGACDVRHWPTDRAGTRAARAKSRQTRQALGATRARAPAAGRAQRTSSALLEALGRELEQAAQDRRAVSGAAGRGARRGRADSRLRARGGQPRTGRRPFGLTGVLREATAQARRSLGLGAGERASRRGRGRLAARGELPRAAGQVA